MQKVRGRHKMNEMAKESTLVEFVEFLLQWVLLLLLLMVLVIVPLPIPHSHISLLCPHPSSLKLLINFSSQWMHTWNSFSLYKFHNQFIYLFIYFCVELRSQSLIALMNRDSKLTIFIIFQVLNCYLFWNFYFT